MQPQLQHTSEAARKLSLRDAFDEADAARGGPSPSQTKSSARRRWPSWRVESNVQPTFPPSRRQSSRRSVPRCAGRVSRESVFRPNPCRNRCQRPPRPPSTFQSFGRGRELQNRKAERGDRKSTRLNSSHLVISYAVFCLKKKKTHSYIPTSSPAGATMPHTSSINGTGTITAVPTDQPHSVTSGASGSLTRTDHLTRNMYP